jgi:hypothetical protein
MNDTFDIFLHMNLTEGKAGRNVVEGCSCSLTCSEYDVAGNEQAIFSITSVDIKKSYQYRGKARVQGQQEYRRKQRRIEVEEGRLRIPNPKTADHLEINEKAGVQMSACASKPCLPPD